ncbi:hypothetical protein PoB_001702400 [Plakobranchus ocellatus]|uniref:Uncharacterized protein n=1 Tax=Plakobranchus ocellatus TaxID=259542 RepID=A0AAV3Z9A6_9GAST|nr:hypothetical protein PoB_001702400 [Plakobranchus ocellatus]
MCTYQKGAVADLVGQLATQSEVRGSNPSPGQANFPLLLCVHPALKGLLGLLRPGESKGGEESNGKLSHNACMPRTIRTYSWFPDAWTKRETQSTNFYLPRRKTLRKKEKNM